jgi:opacity protein-like surface antigen
MKTKFISLIALLALALTAQAQLYINAQVGYAVPSSVTAFDENDLTTTTSSYSEELVVGTNGAGLLPALTVGYMLNENIGVELTGAYLLGSTTSAMQDVDAGFFVVESLLERKTSQIRVSPTVVLKGSGESVKPYAKFGALIPVAGQTTTTQTATIGDDETIGVIETQGRISIGFQGGLGAEFALSDNINLFGEIAFQSLSIQGKSSEVVELTENGVNILSELVPAERLIDYVDELTQGSNNIDVGENFDPTQAREELRPVSPYGNVGINIGVSLNL